MGQCVKVACQLHIADLGSGSMNVDVLCELIVLMRRQNSFSDGSSNHPFGCPMCLPLQGGKLLAKA